MKCPQCQAELKSLLCRGFVLIDVCSSCNGNWLDRGEINFFVENKSQLSSYEKNGLIAAKVSSRICPVCEVSLQKGMLSKGSPFVEECPRCKGLWLEKQQFIQLNKMPENSKASERARFLILPSLGMTSIWVLSSMYAILIGVLVFLTSLGYLNSNIGLYIAVGFVFAQYLFGPLVMDWSLRLMGSLNWIEVDELPEHLSVFIKKNCEKHKIPIPRIGLIEDGSPQAYTYGSTPGSARLVFSQGLLDILDPEEREAVIAHEFGHIVNWDFLLMTLAQLVPLVLYQIYRSIREITKQKGGGSKKGGSAIIVAALVAYVAYLITQYLMLFLSRVREYWADRFSLETTKNPDALIGALSKIAFGLIAYDNENKEKKKTAVQALGVMNISTSKEMALYSSQPLIAGAQDLKEIMRWDLWSPWAGFYELRSTHPLTAKRINAIAAYGQKMGIESSVVFDLKQPESYWDDFAKDLFIYLLPVFTTAIGALLTMQHFGKPVFIMSTVVSLSIGGLLKTLFCYPQDNFFQYSIVSLLKKVKVSPVTAIPVILKGMVIGKGEAGNIFSEDLVIKDSTGLIFLNYEQPLGIANLIFALTKARRFAGQEVRVEGWYRRGPIPYVEIKRISSITDKSTSYVYLAKVIGWVLFPVIVGLFLSLMKR